MSNFYKDNADILFYTDYYIDWGTLVPLKERDFSDARCYSETGDTRYEFAPSSTVEALELYHSVWEQCGELTAKEVWPISQYLDRCGLEFKNGKVYYPTEMLSVIRLFSDAGLMGFPISREYGGISLPIVAQGVYAEILSRGDAALSIAIGASGMAAIVDKYGSVVLKEKYLPRICRGEMFAAMALTEPNYGSDLSRVQTSAIKSRGSVFFELSGTKRFITHGCGIGDKPSVVLTLARSSGKGAKGLSFFLSESSDIEVGGIEKKLGLSVSATCELIFDKTPGVLIGEEGKGLVKYALALMNGARLFVAFQSVGLLESSYREAVKYASERTQFGKPINQLSAVKRILDEVECMLQGARALMYASSVIVDEYDSRVSSFEFSGVAERSIRTRPEIRHLDKLCRLLTPLSKYFCSEYANQGTYKSAQVFGGSGFIEDFPIAKLYRDARIMTIYEGTSQLQVVAAIGGIVEGHKSGGFLNVHVMERIGLLSDVKLQQEFTGFMGDLHDLVSIYKDLSDKARYSVEIVDFFGLFYISLLLALQVDFCKKNKLDFVNTKKRVFTNFYLLATKQMAGIKNLMTNLQKQTTQV